MICYVSACHFLSSASYYSPSILTVPPLSLPTSIFLHRKRLSSNSLFQPWNCSHQLCLVGNLVKKTMMRERIKSKPIKNEDDLKALKRHKNVKNMLFFKPPLEWVQTGACSRMQPGKRSKNNQPSSLRQSVIQSIKGSIIYFWLPWGRNRCRATTVTLPTESTPEKFLNLICSWQLLAFHFTSHHCHSHIVGCIPQQHIFPISSCTHILIWSGHNLLY